MASSVGMLGSIASPFSWMQRGGNGKGKGFRVQCAVSGGLTEEYQTLRVQPGASEKEVKKAFRRLALQYHPDVCKGTNCGVQFHRINEAYEIVMRSLRGPEEHEVQESWDNNVDDSSWDLWEEWMGWEGAGIQDYSSHINPYF